MCRGRTPQLFQKFTTYILDPLSLIITYFLAAICRLGHRHPFFAPKFLPVQWIIKVTEIFYKILTLSNPKWSNDACAIFTSTNRTIRTKPCIMKWTLDQAESLYYEVDPGPSHYIISPWSRFSEIPQPYKFCFSNKLFRGLGKTAADSNIFHI